MKTTAQDWLGNPTTAQGDALAAVDNFVFAMLAYRSKAADVIAAADRHADVCILNVYAGVLCMLSETREAPALATPYLERAERRAGLANAREQMHLDMLRSWVRGDIERALELGEALVRAYPRDLLSVKLHQFISFNRGRSSEMLRIAELAAPSASDVAYLHGMLAFAYEQMHRLEEAEASAQTALRGRRDEAWAQHALAHVMLTQGRIDEGVRFLEAMESTWTGLNSFMLTHLWWHLALFYLSQGREAHALALYDRQVWGVEKSFAQDQVGAVSLLARLELCGVEVGERWDDLGAHLAARAEDAWEPFLAVQYLYGLARAGRDRDARCLMRAIQARAMQDGPRSGEEAVWREVTAPLAEGLLAHACGQYAAAEMKLRPILPRLEAIGGSHAQRDLFELIAIDATLRAGHFGAARERLEARLRFDPDGAPLNRMLSTVYRELGLTEQATAAEQRLRTTLARHSSSLRSAA